MTYLNLILISHYILIIFEYILYWYIYIVKKEVEVISRAFLAQSVERAAFNRKVVGSSPTGGVFFQKNKKKENSCQKKKKERSRIRGRIAQW